MTNDVNHVRMALAQRVAEYEIADEVIDAVAEQLATAAYPIRNIDICPYGICLDYWTEGVESWPTFEEVAHIEGGWLQRVEIFPYGIIAPDIFHTRVTLKMELVPSFEGGLRP